MPSSILTLALGNDILGDDSAALVAARTLKSKFGQRVDFIDTNETGLALLDVMACYDRVLLLDTVVTGEHKPGIILDFSKADFNKVLGSSPHFMGLPEVIELAEVPGIDFPKIIRILAIEIELSLEFSEILSPALEHAMPEYIQKVTLLLKQWT